MSNNNSNKISKNLVKDLWNKHWIYKLILIGIYPVTISYLILTNKKLSKPLKALAIIAFFGILFAITPKDPVENNSTKEKEVAIEIVPDQKNSEGKDEVVTNTEPVKIDTPKESVKEPEIEPTTMDKLWVAVDSGIGSRKGIDIKYGDKSKTAYLTYTDTNFWDENDVVRDAYTKLVKYGKEVFKLNEINEVSISIESGIKDYYGNTNTEEVVRISMTRDNFSKFNWEELKYSNVQRQMENGSSYYYIHPALKSGLKEDKLYLSF